MKKVCVMAFMLVLSMNVCFSQSLTQTIRGTVVDIDSKIPLIGATVIVADSGKFSGTTTDPDGRFRLEHVPIGRVCLKFSYLGYAPLSIPNIEVKSGKEVVLQVGMQESSITLGQAEITSTRTKGEAINEMAQISVHSVSLEETKRFTGGMEDPSRVVAGFAGVSSTPDGSSDIIVRGNSPKYMQWRLDGMEIPSPYHMDDQNASFGALTALNNNLLATSDFYSGAFSAEYGDVLSSVYDVKLRTGNNERFEATAGVGIMGTDLTFEGPFRRGYAGSYLVNYRYSTISLINNLGLVEVPGAVRYQDATFKCVFPAQKLGTFSVYGLAGKSGVSLENSGVAGLPTPGSPMANARVSKDFYKDNFLANLGISHVLQLNSHSFLKTTMVCSGTGSEDDVYERDTLQIFPGPGINPEDSITPGRHTVEARLQNTTLRCAIAYHHKVSARSKFTLGSRYTFGRFDQWQQVWNDSLNTLKRVNDFDISRSSLSNFISWKYSPLEQLILVAGLHNLNQFETNRHTLEPRISLNIGLSRSFSWHIGYGLHSTTERIHNYYTRIPDMNGGFTEPNKKLDLLKAHHAVVGIEKRLNRNLVAKMELYYQYLFNLPVENSLNSSYCTLNEGIDYNYVALVNKGKGKNMGIEISLERFFDKNYYYLINASLFNSRYKALDNQWRSTRYNNNYIVNLLAGKEFRKLGRNDNQILAVNVKMLLEGGQRFIPLLRDNQGNVISNPGSGQYFDYTRAYENQLDDILSLNLSFSYKFNFPRATHELFLDLINLTNNQARMSEYYDEREANKTAYARQFGFFPNLMYRVYF